MRLKRKTKTNYNNDEKKKPAYICGQVLFFVLCETLEFDQDAEHLAGVCFPLLHGLFGVLRVYNA